MPDDRSRARRSHPRGTATCRLAMADAGRYLHRIVRHAGVDRAAQRGTTSCSGSGPSSRCFGSSGPRSPDGRSRGSRRRLTQGTMKREDGQRPPWVRSADRASRVSVCQSTELVDLANARGPIRARRLTKQSNLPSKIARIARKHWGIGRNHNPRVGGSSPSSGIRLTSKARCAS